MREVIAVFGIILVDLVGWEVDDIIVMFMTWVVDWGDEVFIVIGDRDSY